MTCWSQPLDGRVPLGREINDEQAVLRASCQQQGEEQVSPSSDTASLRPQLLRLACLRLVDDDVVHRRGRGISPHLQPLSTRSAPRGRASTGRIA